MKRTAWLRLCALLLLVGASACPEVCHTGSCAIQCAGNRPPLQCTSSCSDPSTSVYCDACPMGLVDRTTACPADAGSDASHD